jgi:hypothetical protein
MFQLQVQISCQSMHFVLRSVLLGSTLCLVGCGPRLAPTDTKLLTLNSDYLARQHDLKHHGLPSILSVNHSEQAVDFHNSLSVLRFILSKLPHSNTVYPTERYFYYQFPLGPRVVSGNIRFADIEDGVVTIGYFDVNNPDDVVTARFDASDSKSGLLISYNPRASTVDLSLESMRTRFYLDLSHVQPSDLDLLPGERVISGILDESGYSFDLVYWETDRSFYYVLQEDAVLPECLSPVITPGGCLLYFGAHSRFCFAFTPFAERLVLIGVLDENVRKNNWFDGPFDQVPPKLGIGKLLEEAYPYVVEVGGIDLHGNFLTQPGQRVAISPYTTYTSGPNFIAQVDQMLDVDSLTPSFWTKMTYEQKKDWRPSLAASDSTPTVAHNSAVSSHWPANHWGTVSRQWGADHSLDQSRSYPPNSIPSPSE